MTVEGLGETLAFAPLAESAVLVRIGDGEEVDPVVVDSVTALTHAIERAAIPGVVDLVPAYATILIEFDPAETDNELVEAAVRMIAASGVSAPEHQARVVIIPVSYGGAHGPDLEETARALGLTPDELVRLHSDADYRVACMGFSPGWAYLIGLPRELTIPRRNEPRTRIPSGSVAVGGGQTGVYPLESPGGWHLIGRTPLRMFDLGRSEPFLLQPGDHVKFAPIDAERYAAMTRALDGEHG
jgi:KipI family sensor histidine kinase inhibitor